MWGLIKILPVTMECTPEGHSSSDIRAALLAQNMHECLFERRSSYAVTFLELNVHFSTVKNKMRSPWPSSVTYFFPTLQNYSLSAFLIVPGEGGGSYGLEVCMICRETVDLWKCCLKTFKGHYELKTGVADELSRKKILKYLRIVKMTQPLGWKKACALMWYLGPSAVVPEPAWAPALGSRRITRSAKSATQETDLCQVVAAGAAAWELAE